MQDDEDDGEFLGEKGFFGEEFPVHGPFVFEGAGELEGAAKVGPGVFAEEGNCEHELGGGLVGVVLGGSSGGHTWTWTM